MTGALENSSLRSKLERFLPKSKPTYTRFESDGHKEDGELSLRDHHPKLSPSTGISDLTQKHSFSPKNKIHPDR